MRFFGILIGIIVCGLCLGMAGRAWLEKENPVQLALGVFETYCVPLKDGRTILPDGSELVVADGGQGRYWEQETSGFMLSMEATEDGFAFCNINGEDEPFTEAEQVAFLAALNEMIARRMPELIHEVAEDVLLPDRQETWMQYDFDDPRQWGVMYVRFGPDLKNGVWVSLSGPFGRTE